MLDLNLHILHFPAGETLCLNRSLSSIRSHSRRDAKQALRSAPAAVGVRRAPRPLLAGAGGQRARAASGASAERPERLQLLLCWVFPIGAKHFLLQLGRTKLFPQLEVNHLPAINL
ncbi:unnamed protein product [Coccothraustes coccothraustes]